jgi:AcrR family transcriptional regulator
MSPSPTPPPERVLPRERLTGTQRRAAILNAAIDLFSSRGFRGTTTREIAAAVGVTEPVLYQHFQTKRALYDAILESKCKEVDSPDIQSIREAAESDDTRLFFTQLGTLFLDWYINDPRYARLLMYASLERDELSQMFYERQVVFFYDLVTGYLNKQMALGRVRRMDPLIAARAFAGMLAHHGLIFTIYSPGELAGGRECILSTVIDIFVKGIESGSYE